MPLRIQRIPRGLNDLLSIAGGLNPVELEDRVAATLDLLQFYGLQQLQTLAASGNPAEGTSVTLTLSATNWALLLGVTGEFTKTATMTALRGEVSLERSSNRQPLTAQELGPFGATETGTCSVPFWAPYPILCPPGSVASCRATIIGTDATVAATVRAQFGIFG